jgi:hypothetical protein
VTVLLLILALLAYLCRRPIGAWMLRGLKRQALSLRPFGVAYVLLLAFSFGVLHLG